MSNTENYYKTALRVAWPAILESLCAALAGIMDTLMVSSLGSYAVAAVGLTMQPKMLFLAPITAISLVISTLIARRKGENNRKGANEVLLWGIIITVIVGVIISALVVVFSKEIMLISGAKSDTVGWAAMYFRIIFGGGLFFMLSLVMSAALRGAGYTPIAMVVNISSNVVNIVLNFILIQGRFGFPKLGILGAAWATVLGTVVSFVMCIYALCNADRFLSFTYAIKEKNGLVKTVYKNIINLLYTVVIEQTLYRLGFTLAAMIAAYLGTEDIAVHQVASNVMWLSFSFADGLQIAATTLIGQSLGRKNITDAKVYGRVCQKIGLAIGLVLSVSYMIFGRNIYELYFDASETSAIHKGVIIMLMMVLIVVMQIPQVIYMGCLRGAGDVVYTTIITVITVTIVRPIFSYVCAFPLGLGIYGVWLGVIIDQVMRLTLTMIRFKSDKWTLIVI